MQHTQSYKAKKFEFSYVIQTKGCENQDFARYYIFWN